MPRKVLSPPVDQYHRPIMRALATAILVLSAASLCFSQEDSLSRAMRVSSVEALLMQDSSTSAASGQRTELSNGAALDVREATGTITILTAEDIKASGARTLEEALALVPGVVIGRDVDDMSGLFIRGQWAHEGKCLFMLNGMPLNESSFGTFALGVRIPMANISRIEVINGSGSLLYGGFAALGVINIITKDVADLEGTEFIANQSYSNGASAFRQLQLYGSHRASAETELSYGVDLTLANRSNAIGNDHTDTPIHYGDSTFTNSMSGYFSLHRRRFRGQFYTSSTSSQVSDRTYDVEMRTVMLQGDQTVMQNSHARIALTGSYRFQLPWNVQNDSSWLYTAINTLDQRASLGADLIWTPGPKWIVRSRISGFRDQSRFLNHTEGNAFNATGTERLVAMDAAWANEITTKRTWGQLTAGSRVEYNTLAELLFAPRIAYVGLFGPLHFKLQAAKAFKTPTFQNIDLAVNTGGLTTESARTYEAEIGFRSNGRWDLSMVAFRSELHAPIVYVYTEATGDSYINRTRSASDGIELRLRYTGGALQLFGSYGHYTADTAWTDLPEIELQQGGDKAFLGAPRRKATLNGLLKLGTQLDFRAAGIWQSEAYSYAFRDASETDLDLQLHPATLRLDLGIGYRTRLVEGLTIVAGCRNILDQRLELLSAYNNGLTAFPLNGREWTLQINYRFPF